MGIFKKKQQRLYIPNKINATTRLSSLYGDDANIRYLEDKVNNLKNVNAYTKQESDARFARLGNQNTFTENQTIKGSTAFIEFKDGSNNRKGYIGKSSASSADVELRAETNSLTLGANHHVILRPGNNYQARYEKTPTEGVEIANKAYVDTKTAANKTILDQHDNRISGNWRVIEENRNNINTLTGKVNTNTSEIEKLKQVQVPQNVAITNKENTFTKRQIMSGGISSGTEPVNNDDVTTKKYVDEKVTTLSGKVTQNTVALGLLGIKANAHDEDIEELQKGKIEIKKNYLNAAIRFEKTHISNGVYMYKVKSFLPSYTINGLLPDKRYEVLVRFRRINGKRINLFAKAMEMRTQSSLVQVTVPQYQFEDGEVCFIWNNDLKPGGSGDTGLLGCELGYLFIPIK